MLNPSSHHQDRPKSPITGQPSRWRDLMWAALLALTILAGLAAAPVEATSRADGPTVGQADSVARART
jgi:hypothetical protein